ncbi:hypothetical protein Cs7R123_32100 [Catellatospora sp. TT07R-123]|uniref:hypothetical protein n=1 Tax=Catellatospora sp. TT07R-123 TaxID=2733863 RepID=UPI001B06EFAD|nr:hypothetical protein [Catellatospora sp. TT07R-123]GHJ45868.1 hypothetical protein Cs7R123_32100 [Catellatospora sp. TT07R-123]
MTTSTPHQVSRALTAREISGLLDRIGAASSTGELASVTIRGLFNVLLDGTGRAFDDFDASNPLDPTRYAIPETQWSAVLDAVTRRAEQWGTGPQLALELINIMPGSYDDPTVPEPVLPQADYRPDVVEVRVSRSAADVITACEQHLHALARFYGERSERYLAALSSWHRHVAGLLTPGAGPQVTVSRDGGMSLYVSTGSLVYGVVFHGDKRSCATPGCAAIPTPERAWRPAYPGAAVLDHEHQPDFPFDGPQPGTWSVHS